MDLHDVSGTSTGQTLPRERRAPSGTHFCSTIWWVYPHSATIFILHPLLSTLSSTFVRNIPTFDHSSTLKRRPQTSVTAADLVWVCAPPRTILKWLRRLAFGSCGPGRIILAAAAADLVWVCAPPRTIRKWLRRLCCCCCFLHINLSGLNHTQYYTWLPIRYVVCWTEKYQRNIYQAPMRAKEKHKHTKNDKEKGTGITKYKAGRPR